MKPLTDQDIAKLKAPATGYTMHKVTPEGLRLKVYKTGVKTLGYNVTTGPHTSQFTKLGAHGFGPDRAPGSLSVAAASDQMHLMRQAKRAQKDVSTRAPLAVATLDADTTFFQLFADYDVHGITLRKCSDLRKTRWRYVIETHFLSQPIPKGKGIWGNMRVGDFASPTCRASYEIHLRTLENQPARGGNRTGKCTLGSITDRMVHGLLAYAKNNGLLTDSDVPERLKGLNKERAIKRSLSIAEIQSVLNATTRDAVKASLAAPLVKGQKTVRMREYDACYLRMLLITGARVNSVRLAKRSMKGTHDKNFFTLPAEDMKETVAQEEEPTDHHIPLTKLFASEIARIDETTGKFDFLFPERWAHAKGRKHKTDDAVARTNDWAKKLCRKKRKLLGNTSKRPYTSQAFRRTMSNMMRDLGVANHVIDAAAGRVPKGTDKTYITAEMLDQVYLAFQAWHAFLTACIHGKGDDWMDDVKRERNEQFDAETAARWKRLGLPSDKRAAA